MSDEKELLQWAINGACGPFKLADAQRGLMWGYNKTSAAIAALLERGEIKQTLKSRGVYYSVVRKK